VNIVARVSLVVATVNRSAELTRLLDSLLNQEIKDFDILIVDQNHDNRIVPVVESYRSKLSVTRIWTPARQGVSAGRNDGWREARGEVIVFPDDDCWYPPWFLRRGLELLETTKAELVSGRSVDETGRSINGRFASRAQFISRRSVWTTQAEWVTFYRRELLERLGGFDEELGLGSPSPWQAAEGPDLILKALQRRCVCYYDPSLYGRHREYDLDDPASGMTTKGLMYGRGMGYVLRRHHFGALSLLHWASRPLFTAIVSAASGKFHRAVYSLSVSLGRLEGWTGRLWGIGKPADVRADHHIGSSASFGKKRREMTGPYTARNPFLVGILYAADAFAGLLPKQQQQIRQDRPLRVLVSNWGHLGDVVTILPLLKFLEGHKRIGEIGVLIGSWSRSVIEASDIAARIHVIDHWALDRSSKSTLRKILRYLVRRRSLVKELSHHRYDVSIDTFSTFPAAHGIAWSASVPRRFGFTSAGLGPLLTDPIDWRPDNRLMLDHQLELLQPLLGKVYPKTLPANYPGFVSTVPRRGLDLGSCPYIVIHMGPQNIRGWVFEKWFPLATALKDQGYELVATGGVGTEMEAARLLSERIAVQDLTGRLSWEQFVATVANATAIVTIDSVAGHVAACFGVPAVVLAAGRQRLGLWRPNNSNVIMLTHTVDCAPCHRANGCAAMACVRQIVVEAVLSSLQQVIKTNQPH
jgi:ADP-heptose:LPS heptosyltransferase/glycosyltransferase involved in cell wall biosynthesis